MRRGEAKNFSPYLKSQGQGVFKVCAKEFVLIVGYPWYLTHPLILFGRLLVHSFLLRPPVLAPFLCFSFSLSSSCSFRFSRFPSSFSVVVIIVLLFTVVFVPSLSLSLSLSS